MRFPLSRHSVAIMSAFAMLFAAPDALPLSAQTRMSAPRFTLRVPTPPTVGHGETGAFLVYELHLTNFAAQQWTLQKVEILSGSPDPRALQTLEDRELASAIVRPGTTIPADQRRVFAGGAWGVVMLWVPVDRAAAPASLSHRLTFALDNAASAATSELHGAATTVRRETVTIGPPLRGGPWRAGNFTNAGAHRRASMFGYGGDATINSRFAIDYARHGPDDRAYTGERTRNENWHAYGQEVVAVADALVVATSDGVADNTFSGAPGPPDIQTIRGNHIILEVAPRVYATYAHLKPGSLRVAMGQRVTRGQVIGQVGNTGASGAPHLHFQLSEAPDVTSDGVPYAHASFDVVARCQQTGPSLADQTCAHVPPETRRGEIPLNGMLVRFPAGESASARDQARAVSPRDAVERAIPLLQDSAQTWTRERRCASCHHQGLGPIAMAVARERGFHLDESLLRAQGVPLAASAESDAAISSTLTPLMRAALFGSVDEMRSVLTEKPDVNAAATKLGITALMCAAHDATKVRLLVDAGANVRAATTAGHTALLVAADYAGAAESVRVLLQHGADPNIRTKAFLATPLARATLHGDRTVVALLLDAGAAVNDRSEGSVALLAAANQGDRDMVTLLLDRGANIESHPMATVPITNGEQLPTPLMLAADRQWTAIVKLLLIRGANPNARDRQGMTPLMYAAGAIQTAVNATPVIETLIAAKADIDARAANGDTAWHLAERFGNEAAIAALKAARRPTR